MERAMKTNKSSKILIFFLSLVAVISAGSKPNIILIVTDDEDLELYRSEGWKRKWLLNREGVTFSEGHVTSPICCVSRTSILTGMYAHNHGTINNSISGGCNGRLWRDEWEHSSLAVHLNRSGYTNFFVGKYLNKYGSRRMGGEYVPPGWHHWFGLIGNSRYYNYRLSENGRLQSPEEYLPRVVLRKSLEFLDSRNRGSNKTDIPFFMLICPPSPHAPFTPDDRYKARLLDSSSATKRVVACPHLMLQRRERAWTFMSGWTKVFHLIVGARFSDVERYNNASAPRGPSYNYGNWDKHWIVRRAPHPMSPALKDTVDFAYRNRKRTLLSIDDLVAGIVKKLQNQGLLDSTYILYTSDNGFHTGQFCLPLDKRQPYEFDTRVPMVLRGPGIPKNLISKQMVLNIDIAPTLMHLAGGSGRSKGFQSHRMDGKSFLPLRKYPTRRNFLIEYWGESKGGIASGCPPYPNLSHCIKPGCICEDSLNNTYVCLRTPAHLYCRFKLVEPLRDKENFEELYNLKKDPFQLNNLAKRKNVSTWKNRLNRYTNRYPILRF